MLARLQTRARTAGSGSVGRRGRQRGGKGRLPIQRLRDAAAVVVVVAAVGAALPGAAAAALVRVLVAPQVRDGVLEGAAAGPHGALPPHRRAEQGVAVRVHGRVVVHAVVAAVATGLRRWPGARTVTCYLTCGSVQASACVLHPESSSKQTHRPCVVQQSTSAYADR